MGSCARSCTVANKNSCILRQPFVTRCLNIVMFAIVQENPGNNEDLEDLHVLQEGEVVLLGKLSSSPILLTGIEISRNHGLRQFWPVIKFSSYD